MEPIIFGQAKEKLYGVLHEPEGTKIQEFAVLICYPFGQEYMISHRALSTLCRNLSRVGVPCMRFDYAGTGDSYDDQFSIKKCVDNTIQAIHELTEYTGLEDVKIVGLRVGAAIAAMAAERSDAVRSIVLWDPIIKGAAYLDEMSQCSTSVYKRDETLWVNGYPLSSTVMEELRKIDLNTINYQNMDALCFVFTQLDSEAEKLIGSLKQRNLTQQIDKAVIDDVKSWVQVDFDGSFVLPSRILKKIEEWVLRDN